MDKIPQYRGALIFSLEVIEIRIQLNEYSLCQKEKKKKIVSPEFYTHHKCKRKTFPGKQKLTGFATSPPVLKELWEDPNADMEAH